MGKYLLLGAVGAGIVYAAAQAQKYADAQAVTAGDDSTWAKVGGWAAPAAGGVALILAHKFLNV